MAKRSASDPIRFDVAFLAKYDFDYAVGRNILYHHDKYRLIRERNNPHDPNAVAVYVNQVKLGYIPRTKLSRITPKMDNGDVFRVWVNKADYGNEYNPRQDNSYSDGYYRKLTIEIFNESEEARESGTELDYDRGHHLAHKVFDPDLKPPAVFDGAAKPGGCGCLVLLIGGLTLASLSAIAALFS